ncbi:transcriptional regulator, LacI family [Ruminococcaceae bacterium FB2012]|nr:transcriptional regulator, LacI family [Ruminococcaceae bacterium FB2012]
MKNSNNQKKAQLEDVAAALGLSKSTVSRAISGKGRIKAETRERVFECIRELNYRPNMIAKSLSEQKTYNIGVVVPMDQSENEAPFFQTCIAGIAKGCAVRDYDAVLIGTERDNLSQLTRVIENRKVDGVIVTRPVSEGRIEMLLSENGMPFVVVGKSVHADSVIVDSDHVNGCRELTNYLIMSNPADRIGLLLGSTEYTVNKSRYTGFASAFEKSGRHFNDRLVFTEVDSEMQFSKAAEMLFREDPACVICGDDMLCMRLLSKLNELGKSVPQDVKIASFYNSVYLDSYSPPITSLKFDAVKLGTAAAEKVLDIIAGVGTETASLMDFELKIRKSTI